MKTPSRCRARSTTAPLQAEALAEAAAAPAFSVRVLRMARCFPEPPERMAMFRLHRGIDARDSQRACCTVAGRRRRFRALHRVRRRRSGVRIAWSWPPTRAACWHAARHSCWPSSNDGWPPPLSIDRVYDSARLRSVLAAALRPGRRCSSAAGSIEVLPRAEGSRIGSPNEMVAGRGTEPTLSRFRNVQAAGLNLDGAGR